MNAFAKKTLALFSLLLIAAASSPVAADSFVIDMHTDEGKKLANTLGTAQYRYALFKEFGKDTPYSSIALSHSKDFKDGTVTYNAVIATTGDGARIFFTHYAECGKLQTVDGFIEVSDQPVKVLYECREEKPGTKVSIFMPVSDAAQQFIYDAFAKSAVVKVRMDKHAVVFTASGFQEAWSLRNQKAL